MTLSLHNTLSRSIEPFAPLHPPREAPPGFRVTATGLEADLGWRSAESALAVCRAHKLHVRASRVRLKTLDEATHEADVTPR